MINIAEGDSADLWSFGRRRGSWTARWARIDHEAVCHGKRIPMVDVSRCWLGLSFVAAFARRCCNLAGLPDRDARHVAHIQRKSDKSRFDSIDFGRRLRNLKTVVGDGGCDCLIKQCRATRLDIFQSCRDRRQLPVRPEVEPPLTEPHLTPTTCSPCSPKTQDGHLMPWIDIPPQAWK